MQPLAESRPTLPRYPGIFLLSLPRTGSTVLRLVLDTHPDIYCPDELNLGALLGALYHTADGIAECSGTSVFSARDIDSAGPAASTARRVVDELLTAAMRRKGKSLWCDKSPSNLGYLDLIAGILPDARYILLHRHCFDFVHSCLRVSMLGMLPDVVEDYVRRDHKAPLRATLRAWEEKTRELLRFEHQHGGRCCRVRYEDLVADPEACVRRLCEFLGLPFAPQLLAQVFSSPHHQRTYTGDPTAFFSQGIVDRSVGSGAGLSIAGVRTTPASLLRRMNELLDNLGYPAVQLTANGFDTGLVRRPGAAAAVPANAAAAAPATAAADFFARTAERLRLDPSLAGRIKRSFRFVLTGEGGGTWVLDLREPPGSVLAGDAPAQCALTLANSDFVAIITGGLNPVAALQQGRLALDGQVGQEILRELLMALVPVSAAPRGQPGVPAS